MKKTYLLTLGLVGSLFLGCANKNNTITSQNFKSQHIKNIYYKAKPKYSLYMPIDTMPYGDVIQKKVVDKNKLLNSYKKVFNYKNIYSRRNIYDKKKLYSKAVELNTLKPIGYKKFGYKFDSVSDWGLGSMKKKGLKCKGFYKLEKHYSSKDIATNVTVGVLSFGLAPAIFGTTHGEQCVFDNIKFEKFVLNYLKQNNINRKQLIDEYAKLVDQANSENKKILDNYYSIKSENEKIKSLPVKKKYNDKTGFFKQDKIDIEIKKYIKMPQKPDLKAMVSSAFPCTPMQGCLNNFSIVNNKITLTTKNYIAKLKEGNKNKEFIKYAFSKNPHKYDNKRGKILYYNVTVNPKTDTATYTIYRADFYDAIPHYSIKNAVIKVEELPNGYVKFTNYTNKFLDVNTLSIYFKDRIVNVPVNLQLAPHGEKDLYVKGFADVVTELNNLHGRIDFKEFYTLKDIKAKDINKKITVGLAVKYKIAGSNKSSSLYQETKYPIKELIKDKI